MSLAKLITDHVWSEADARRKKTAFSLLEKDPQARVLDCGCSDGELAVQVAKVIGTNAIYGVDAMPESLRKAQSKGIKAYQCDLNGTLPFESESFDVVHANQVIEHLANTDIFLKEANRVLKAGGYLIVSTPNLASIHNIVYLMFARQPAPAWVSDEVIVGTWNTGSKLMDRSRGPSHRRLFTLRALAELCEYHGLTVEKRVGSGFYPFPGPLGNALSFIAKQHAAYITVKARKRKLDQSDR